jgi:nucleoside-diphosphate kinase
MAIEQTLVILKPEAVEMAKVGRILAIFEDAGLKIERMQMMVASEETLNQHYPSDDVWLSLVAGKTLDSYEKFGGDAMKVFGTVDKVAIGKQIKQWLVSHMASGPVVVMVVSGNHAIEAVRKLVGSTSPLAADPGTIRAMFSTDSPDYANAELRPIKNLVHASGDVEEAKREIALWFGTVPALAPVG